MKRLNIASACALILLSTAACSSTEKTTVVQAPPAPPAVGSLSRTLNMVDSDGRIYGTVELDPVGGGRVIDSSGRTIGKIVPPDRY